MIPFALPMVLAPRFTTWLSNRYSGRTLLTAGLATTAVGNVLFWIVARNELPYAAFIMSRVIAGCGAGVLNGTTVKVMGNVVPPDRAGMASGLASTTRFIGILVAVAGLGAVLASGVRASFVAAAITVGLSPDAAETAAHRVVAGDLAEMLNLLPDGLRPSLRHIGLAAFSDGFAAAALLVAIVAATASVLSCSLSPTVPCRRRSGLSSDVPPEPFTSLRQSRWCRSDVNVGETLRLRQVHVALLRQFEAGDQGAGPGAACPDRRREIRCRLLRQQLFQGQPVRAFHKSLQDAHPRLRDRPEFTLRRSI
jgi:hypothetical protein